MRAAGMEHALTGHSGQQPARQHADLRGVLHLGEAPKASKPMNRLMVADAAEHATP
jgi:hypothetical protein